VYSFIPGFNIKEKVRILKEYQHKKSPFKPRATDTAGCMPAVLSLWMKKFFENEVVLYQKVQ
jgi:hypothetical protein